MAGEEGVEPSSLVLETSILPLNYSPNNSLKLKIKNLKLIITSALSFKLLVISDIAPNSNLSSSPETSAGDKRSGQGFGRWIR